MPPQAPSTSGGGRGELRWWTNRASKLLASTAYVHCFYLAMSSLSTLVDVVNVLSAVVGVAGDAAYYSLRDFQIAAQIGEVELAADIAALQTAVAEQEKAVAEKLRAAEDREVKLSKDMTTVMEFLKLS